MMDKFHFKITKNDEIVADTDVDCFVGSFHKLGESEVKDVSFSECEFSTIVMTSVRLKILLEIFFFFACSIIAGIKSRPV